MKSLILKVTCMRKSNTSVDDVFYRFSCKITVNETMVIPDMSEVQYNPELQPV